MLNHISGDEKRHLLFRRQECIDSPPMATCPNDMSYTQKPYSPWGVGTSEVFRIEGSITRVEVTPLPCHKGHNAIVPYMAQVTRMQAACQTAVTENCNH